MNKRIKKNKNRLQFKIRMEIIIEIYQMKIIIFKLLIKLMGINKSKFKNKKKLNKQNKIKMKIKVREKNK